MATLKDIAEQAGVSASTVSRALNGKEYINPQKRAQILKLLEENSYVLPVKTPRSSADGVLTVGVVIPDTFNMFQRQLFSIIQRFLTSFGYNTQFFFIKRDKASQMECLQRIKSDTPNGIILLDEISSPDFCEYIALAGLPVVSTIINNDDFPTIMINDRQAAVDAVNHLIGLGHRKINFLGGSGFSFGLERIKGYYDALEAAGLEPDKSRCFCDAQYSTEDGMYGMREMLLHGRDFTALFAASDELAMGAIRALKDAGIRVPDDVSVIGFDNIENAKYFIPRLTTIHQPIEEIGEHAVTNLRRLMGVATNVYPEIIIPHKLIIRESTSSTAG
ncbi:MAG: LacI family transcriptional regulator [Spirochaetes bacterium]|nr:LacI family transcriptional regulator [Spirochaetota bacterium]